MYSNKIVSSGIQTSQKDHTRAVFSFFAEPGQINRICCGIKIIENILMTFLFSLFNIRLFWIFSAPQFIKITARDNTGPLLPPKYTALPTAFFFFFFTELFNYRPSLDNKTKFVDKRRYRRYPLIVRVSKRRV